MLRRSWCALILVFFLVLPSLVGCGHRGPKVFPVSGTVTVDRQPLADGLIYFKTVQTGVAESFPIKDGAFEGQAQEGERRIEIYSYRTKVENFSGMKGEVKENLIPNRYNLESNLTAKVTPNGPNQFTFELTKK